ncbi:MAG: ABC1 kinase family protein [Shimia sp.]
MTDARPRPIPASRAARFAGLSRLGAGMAGRMAAGAAGQVLRGQRPDPQRLLLTPANARALADQLARMRGAAMKMGQLLSLDATEVLPPELSDILSRLRAEADFMPPKQLKQVLTQEWGADWLKQFRRFDPRPIAAASIGQVHRAERTDGRVVAIKVQYPGVRRAVDSDVANVAAMIRMSGLVPKGLDLAPVIEEARISLHEEADYEREAAMLTRFRGLAASMSEVTVPALHADLSTRNILVMDFAEGVSIESLVTADQATRDRAMAILVDLVLRELFEWRLMQTDPNFANFKWDGARVVLLDFGATREVPEALSDRYRQLVRDGLASRPVDHHLEAMGVLSARTAPHHRAMILEMMEIGFTALRAPGPFDFADRTLTDQLRDKGMTLGMEGTFADVPEPEVLFFQRKFAGLALLATRLGARIDLQHAVRPFCEGP